MTEKVSELMARADPLQARYGWRRGQAVANACVSDEDSALAKWFRAHELADSIPHDPHSDDAMIPAFLAAAIAAGVLVDDRPRPSLTPDQIVEILRITAFDYCESLFWREVGGVLCLFVNCSDTFAYATADLEEVTPGNIDVLRQSFADCRGLPGNDVVADILFCARVRHRQPMQAWLDQWAKLASPAELALFADLPPG